MGVIRKRINKGVRMKKIRILESKLECTRALLEYLLIFYANELNYIIWMSRSKSEYIVYNYRENIENHGTILNRNVLGKL